MSGNSLNSDAKSILDENIGSTLTNALIVGLAAEMTAIILNTASAARQRGYDEGREAGRMEGAQAAAQAHGMMVAAAKAPTPAPVALEAVEVPEEIPYRDPPPCDPA